MADGNNSDVLIIVIVVILLSAKHYLRVLGTIEATRVCGRLEKYGGGTPPPSSARATLSERDLPRERLFQKSGNAIARANHARMR